MGSYNEKSREERTLFNQYHLVRDLYLKDPKSPETPIMKFYFRNFNTDLVNNLSEGFKDYYKKVTGNNFENRSKIL